MKKPSALAIIVLVLLVIVSLIYLFPIYWTLVTSLKTNIEIFRFPPVFFPVKIDLGNFYVAPSTSHGVSQTAIGSLPWLIDSSVIAVVATLVSTFLIAAPAAYSLVRYIRNVWLGRLILFMTMIPEAAFIVPFFVIIARINLLNTWWGLIIIYLSFTAPFATWLMMGFFNDIPKSVEEAAQIDGLSPYQIFYRISLRLVVPGLVAALILNFITCWNELLYALILTYSPFPTGAETVNIFLTSFLITDKSFAWGGLAAAGIIIMIPTIIMGVFAQRYLARGLTLGAVKG
ncbi:MAG: carbohydrate ABC transporter permease [Nitrososphaerota archaeon]|nr:carbohydrate ABC transporter permease [Nitrososphaerota archaeon]MDG7051507.1 carbohydrate ABC transporter permease [Nitrososphaerota archaeon]